MDLVIFYCIPNTLNFTLLRAGYLNILINIFELCSVMWLIYLEIDSLGLALKKNAFVRKVLGGSRIVLHLGLISPQERGKTLPCISSSVPCVMRFSSLAGGRNQALF